MGSVPEDVRVIVCGIYCGWDIGGATVSYITDGADVAATVSYITCGAMVGAGHVSSTIEPPPVIWVTGTGMALKLDTCGLGDWPRATIVAVPYIAGSRSSIHKKL